MEHKNNDAELDCAIVIGMLFNKTPFLSNLCGMAEEIAKHSNFSAANILEHIQKRVKQAIDLPSKHPKKENIGFVAQGNDGD